MTPVENIIREEIAAGGPMPLDRYMELCLSHPVHGYYMARDPFGAAGDFTTAPEISQMFGELVGLWLAQTWINLGRPNQFNLVELGPGRGTLMADVLRVGQSVPGFLDASRLYLVENSDTLRSTQQESLPGVQANWLSHVTELQDLPTLLIANEFFDALPVAQYQKVGDVWLERVIRVDGDNLAFGHRKTAELGFGMALPDGTIVERSASARRIASEIGALVNDHGGAALIFDYGDAQGSGDTLQAVRGHAYTDPLAEPGLADLTTHVNFGDLARAVEPCAIFLTTQGQFLASMGIAERAETLARGKGDEARAQINAALHRLTHEDEMGRLFKAMAITRAGDPKPLGF